MYENLLFCFVNIKIGTLPSSKDGSLQLKALCLFSIQEEGGKAKGIRKLSYRAEATCFLKCFSFFFLF